MMETIWTYQIRAEKQREFERAYAADGNWAKLFRKAPGYRGTRLLRDLREPGRYATVDTWESLEALEEFKKRFTKDYEELDRLCGELTLSEEHVGMFEIV